MKRLLFAALLLLLCACWADNDIFRTTHREYLGKIVSARTLPGGLFEPERTEIKTETVTLTVYGSPVVRVGSEAYLCRLAIGTVVVKFDGIWEQQQYKVAR